MKYYLCCMCVVLSVSAWAREGESNNKHTETFRRNQARQEHQQQQRYREAAASGGAIVSAEEERLWRECQREAARLQPTAGAPEGGACHQLSRSQARRGYTEIRWNGGMGRMCSHDAWGNVLSCF